MTKRKSIASLVLLLGVAAIVLSACSSLNPGEVKLMVDGTEIESDLVDRLPEWAFRLESDHLGRAYITATVETDSGTAVRRIYRRSRDSDWEVVFDYEFHAVAAYRGMRIRPGSSEIFVRGCTDPSVDQVTEEDTFRLYRLEGTDLIDISDDYWGGISKETLFGIGITDCSSNWDIDGEGALILVTENSVWKVHGGQVETLLDDISSVMRVPEYSDDYCTTRQIPEARANASGEVLIYYFSRPCGLSDGSLPDAVLITESEVKPLLKLSNKLHNPQYIRDAWVGPDGAAYFLLRESATDGSLGSIYRGVRITGAESAEFMTLNANIDTVLHAISVSDTGRIFMIYGGGNEATTPKFWLLGFPAEF